MFELESAYVDVEAIAEGRWLPIGADFPGVEILARGLSAPGAKRATDVARRKAPRAERLANGRLSDEAEERILRQVITDHCVLDWRGLSSGGEPLPFAKETLSGIMTEPRARKIAIAIVNAIIDLEQTTIASREEVSGNSAAP